MTKTRKIVYLSFFVTLATALSAIEAVLPNPFPLPGVKLGLANIVSIVVLYLFGFRGALAVSLLRVFFTSLLTGTFLSVGFYFSLSGALCSITMMSFLLGFCTSFSILGVSVAGAIAHNIGQLLAVSVLIQTIYIYYYLPILLFSGIPTGLVTGSIARLLLKQLRGINLHGR